ncbi:MAG: hypothetical protein ACYC3S_06295 [Chloroflexota bacterium]
MTDEQQIQEQAEPTKYYIDTNWYDESDRSFRVVAEKRFCAGCQSKVGTEVQERVPTIDPKTGRVVYEVRSVPYGSNPIAVIRSCCAKERGYITADMPVLESVFRIFLMNGNQPTELETVREELAQWFPLTVKSHGYSADLLRRLIGADTYYGLREFKTRPVE